MKFAATFKEHIHRYAFAMDYCWKRDVLDAGGKEGFGTVLLSMVSNSVANADINKQWLKTSQKHNYWCHTVNHYLVDFDKSFPEGEWDTIVAFEIIEHVENPDFFIENMAKHLKPGGRLVFSVPHMVANHEHKTLYDEDGIRKAISKHLDIEFLYVQDKQYLSNEPMYKGLKCYVGVAKKREN